MHTLNVVQKLCSRFPLTKEEATLTTSMQRKPLILAERDVGGRNCTFLSKISGLDNVYEMVLYYALVAGILSCNNMIFTSFLLPPLFF